MSRKTNLVARREAKQQELREFWEQINRIFGYGFFYKYPRIERIFLLAIYRGRAKDLHDARKILIRILKA